MATCVSLHIQCRIIMTPQQLQITSFCTAIVSPLYSNAKLCTSEIREVATSCWVTDGKELSYIRLHEFS